MRPQTLFELLVLEAVVYGLQILFYFGCEKFQKDFHDVSRNFDRKVPMIPATVLIYMLWFPMIGLFPLAAFRSDPDAAFMYMICIIVCDVISIPVYMIYPTTFERPLLGNTMMDKLLGFVRGASYRGLNCAPSLHCSQCYVTIVCAMVCRGMPIALKAVFIAAAAGVVISTQTTKQHVIIDALTAIPVAAAAAAAGFLVL
ncbi:MAG TPA: serine/threonine protein phosphatase [Lachnospiraceae bacterium]|nr:serine/threonine protein phosphatase [Lachnospiraceae bacterium]